MWLTLLKHWKLALGIDVLVLCLSVSAYAAYLNMKLKDAEAEVAKIKFELAIEKSNNDALTAKSDLQNASILAVTGLSDSCFENRKLESSLLSQYDEILLNINPLPADQKQSEAGIKVVDRETRIRGIDLVNSLHE